MTSDSDQFEFWSCVVGKKSCVVGKKLCVKSRGSKMRQTLLLLNNFCFSKTRVSDRQCPIEYLTEILHITRRNFELK